MVTMHGWRRCLRLGPGALHDADQGLAVGGDGEAFHALVGDAATGVGGDLGGFGGGRGGGGQTLRQGDHAGALASAAVEAVDVGGPYSSEI